MNKQSKEYRQKPNYSNSKKRNKLIRENHKLLNKLESL